MEHRWYVLYYETVDGKCPVMEFIDFRSKRNQAKILSLISYLEEMGPNLPRPYADFLSEGIHELLIKLSGSQIRILYFFYYRKFIVLTHAFIKKTDKVPIFEIKQAKKYRKDFLDRVNEDYLRRLTDEDL